MKETPANKVKRLSESISIITGEPIGVAECGCPNKTTGEIPALHICLVCGFEGGYVVHQNCPGCLYKNSKNEISDRFYPR